MTTAPQAPTIPIAAFRLHDELLRRTITVPVKTLSVFLCIYTMLDSIMVKLKYGSLSILGHSWRNIVPLVGNQGAMQKGITEAFEWIYDHEK